MGYDSESDHDSLRSSKNKKNCDNDQDEMALQIAWGIVLAVLILIILGFFFSILSYVFYTESWSGSRRSDSFTMKRV